MKRFCLFIITILLSQLSNAQKVGLVLSGGGAKGLTHIGVIRALEENNIPIDYIAGTSMGAIIGSLYAMGYSPDEMTELILSKEFESWATGNIDEKYVYHFKKEIPKPDFLKIKFNLGEGFSGFSSGSILPTSIVNPIQMNIVFLDLYARSTAYSKGNFDKLFVPFRCIASDIYNKKELVMSGGDLGDAVRASMTFPFMFKPIEIDSVLAYDGGIYNNFPTDVMMNDFQPDIMIGSVVASNPTKPKEDDVMSQLENMIMQKSNYSIPDSLGFLLEFKYDDVSLMDFNKVKELEQIGYEKTISIMDKIKARIVRRVSKRNIQFRRLIYKSNLPDLIFKDIIIEGANDKQQLYIRKEFNLTKDGSISLEEAREGYFRLMAESMISEVIPHAIYNKDDNSYSLKLNVKLDKNFTARFGGNISSASSNQTYMGLSYRSLNFYPKEILIDGQLGKAYNNVQFTGKIDIPSTKLPISLKLIASYSKLDYFKQYKLFSNKQTPSLNGKQQTFVKGNISMPFLTNKKADIGFGWGRLEDYYSRTSFVDFNNLKFDKSVYKLYSGNISFEGNTFNSKLNATKGYAEKLVAQIFFGEEYYYDGNKMSNNTSEFKDDINWLQVSYTMDRYIPLSRKFVLGTYGKLLYSSKNLSENYLATIMSANDFSPTSHSKLSFNKYFRANHYIALGVKPIYIIDQMFHLRSEVYCFSPIYPIELDLNNKAKYGKPFSRFSFMGELSLVCQLPIGDISLFVNHYSHPKGEWNFGLSIGWLLFNNKFIE